MGGRCFWEIFSGAAVLSNAFKQAGWLVAPPIDIQNTPTHDVLNPHFQAIVIGLLLEGRVSLLHLGPPYSSSSTALADACVKLTAAQDAAKGHWQAEQPASSPLLLIPPWEQLQQRAWKITRDMCMDGAPWRKPTALLANHECIKQLACNCDGTHTHIALAGKAPCSRKWTDVACPYWPQFAAVIVKCWSHLLSVEQAKYYTAAACRSGFALASPASDMSLDDVLETSGWAPSGKRSRTTVAFRIAAGLQPRGHAIPQLIPDLLGPETHLAVACTSLHPALRPPPLFPPVRYAHLHQPNSPHATNAQREKMLVALQALADSTMAEAALLHERAPHPTQKVLTAGGPLRNIPFMREISHIIGHPDHNLLADYTLGLPMLGWALHAPTMVERFHPPETTITDLKANSRAHNQRLTQRTKPSNDAVLDEVAWQKSLDEVALGILTPPVYDLSDLNMDTPCLVRRHGIWEQHGEALEPSCRVLDDFLEGTQNSTVGYQHTHRPANLDALSASLRAIGTRFSEKLMLFTSDFAKAFKQIPGVVSLLDCSVIVQWDPHTCRPAFMIPLTQVFGGRSTPLNFSRYPSWCCYAMACLGALPAEHCVDDVIVAERACTIMSGWTLWRKFADLCGWRVPDTKSPEPTNCQTVLGAEIDTSSFPHKPVVIRITKNRTEVLLHQLHEILAANNLPAGLSGQIWGKLQHACSMLWGRYGAAKLRPFARRQRDGYLTLNPQLRSSITWWISTLQGNQFPRQVSLFLRKKKSFLIRMVKALMLVLVLACGSKTTQSHWLHTSNAHEKYACSGTNSGQLSRTSFRSKQLAHLWSWPPGRKYWSIAFGSISLTTLLPSQHLSTAPRP